MDSKIITEAVILAGGLGTRLAPLTNYRPKPLLAIGNYSMLDWTFFMLASNGIERIIVVVNYLGDQIKNHIKNVTSKIHPSLEIIVLDVNSKGTADAVHVVSNMILSDNFFVTMSDIVTNIDLKEMAQFHFKNDGIATISLKSTLDDPKQFGVVLIDEKGKILRFLEKPSLEELHVTKKLTDIHQLVNYQANLISSGIYCFKKEILDILENINLSDFGKNVFPFLLQRKLGIFGFRNEEDYYWKDCGNPNQLLDANLDVLKGENWPYSPKGTKENGSWIGNDHKFEKIFIKRPVAIGNNVQIKTGTKIHLSSINDECTIGKHCKISKSLIWEHVTIGNGVSIENSIISDNVIIGDNCTIEEETMIPSGYIIPSNSYIKKGVVILDYSSKIIPETIF